MDNGFKSKYLRRLAPGGLTGVIGQSTGLTTNLARNIVVPQLLDLKGIYVLATESNTADTPSVSVTSSMAMSFALTETGTDAATLVLTAPLSLTLSVSENSTADTASLTLSVPLTLSMALTEATTADTSTVSLAVLSSLSFTILESGTDTADIILALEPNAINIAFDVIESLVDDVADFSLSIVDNTNLSFDLVEETGDDVFASGLEVLLGLTLDLFENQEDDNVQMSMTVALVMDMLITEEGFDTFDMFVQRHLTKQITLYPATRLTPLYPATRLTPSFTSGVSLSTLKVETRKIPAIGE